MLHVKQKPSQDTLAEVRSYIDGTEPPLPGGWHLMTQAEFKAWEQSELAAGWAPPPPTPQPYRVSKDTIITRCLEANALPAVMAALSQQSAEQQFVFAQSAWFWSTNATLRGMCAALGLDAEVILAPDPHI